MNLDLRAIARLRNDERHQALRAIAEKMVSEEVPDHELEDVEDVIFLLEEFVRQHLYRSLKSGEPRSFKR